MLTGDLIDTFLNLGTFLFLGAMAWLVIRPLPERVEKRGRKSGDAPEVNHMSE